MAPTSILFYKEVGHSQEGAQEVVSLMGSGAFDGPKPVRLLSRLLTLANLEENSIVLDFFSGSATTAHAVMRLNAEDANSGNRKFILVQLPEKTRTDSPAEQAGYKTIDEIGQERIRRAAAKIKAEMESDLEKRARVAEMDFGFRHYTLKEPDDNTLDKLETFDSDGLVSDKTVLDEFGRDTVLATWLNADGYGLTARAEAVALERYTAWRCGRHLYFLDPGLTDGDVVKLVERYGTDAAFNAVNWVVFGYSFSFTELEMLKKNAPPLEDGRKNLRVRVEVRY